jgi:hypothetical protein
MQPDAQVAKWHACMVPPLVYCPTGVKSAFSGTPLLLRSSNWLFSQDCTTVRHTVCTCYQSTMAACDPVAMRGMGAARCCKSIASATPWPSAEPPCAGTMRPWTRRRVLRALQCSGSLQMHQHIAAWYQQHCGSAHCTSALYTCQACWQPSTAGDYDCAQWTALN